MGAFRYAAGQRLSPRPRPYEPAGRVSTAYHIVSFCRENPTQFVSFVHGVTPEIISVGVSSGVKGSKPQPQPQPKINCGPHAPPVNGDASLSDKGSDPTAAQRRMTRAAPPRRRSAPIMRGAVMAYRCSQNRPKRSTMMPPIRRPAIITPIRAVAPKRGTRIVWDETKAAPIRPPTNIHHVAPLRPRNKGS